MSRAAQNTQRILNVSLRIAQMNHIRMANSIMAEVTFQKILITLVAPRKHSAEPDVHKCVIFSRINMAHTVYVVP